MEPGSQNPEFRILTDEPDETLATKERSITSAHRSIVGFLSAFRTEIESQITQPDPSGWRVYAYNPETTTPRQVLDTDPQKILNVPSSQWPKEPDPIMEAHFYPANTDVQNGHSRPTSIQISIGDLSVSLEFFPMGTPKSEFSVMEIRLPQTVSTRRAVSSKVVSEIGLEGKQPYDHKPDSVTTEGISIAQVSNAINRTEESMQTFTDFAKGLAEGKYYLRIFGNSHNSPMKPMFRVNEEEPSA